MQLPPTTQSIRTFCYVSLLILLVSIALSIVAASPIDIREKLASFVLYQSIAIGLLSVVGWVVVLVVSLHQKTLVSGGTRSFLGWFSFISIIGIFASGTTGELLKLEQQQSITIGNGEITLSGAISRNLVNDLSYLIADNHNINRVYLSGSGGVVEQAMEAAVFLKAKGVQDVVINGICDSACAFLALLLPQRYLSDSGKLGFHALHAPGRSDESLTPLRERLLAEIAANGIEATVIAAWIQDDEIQRPSIDVLLGHQLIKGCWKNEQPIPCQ